MAVIVALSCLLVACGGDRYCCYEVGLCTDLPFDDSFYLRWTGGVVAALAAAIFLICVIAMAVDLEWGGVAGLGFLGLVCGALAWWAYPGATAPSTTAAKKFDEYCEQEKKKAVKKKAVKKKVKAKKEEEKKRFPAKQLPAVKAMDKKLRELIRRRVELRKKYKRELGDYLAEIRRRARQASLKTHGELLEKKNDHLRIYLLVQRVGRLTHLLKCLESKQQSDERASAFLDHYTWYLQKAIETGSVVSDKLRKEVQTNMQIARAVLAEKHPPLDKVQVARLEREAFQKALRAKDGHGTK